MHFLRIQVWDAVKGEEELTLQHKHIVKSVKFSPNGGNILATASNDKLLRYVSKSQLKLRSVVGDLSFFANYTFEACLILKFLMCKCNY